MAPVGPAAAQQTSQADCSADPAACGKKEFERGVADYQKGDYASAQQHFKQALAYRPHPVVAFNLALAEGKGGLLVEAVARLDQVMADPRSSATLKASATRERDAFAAAVGAIALESELSSGVEATVDGAALTGSPPAIQVNPGEHRMVVRVDGRVVIDRPIAVKPGERVRLAISREREVSVVVPPPPHAAPTPKPSPPPPPAKGIDPIWFYGGAGLTLVLGGVATWSALDTRSAYDDYKAALPTASQAEIDRRVSDGHGKETRTNVLLGASALAALGTAAVGVFAVNWGASETSTTVSLTPGGVALSGRF